MDSSRERNSLALISASYDSSDSDSNSVNLPLPHDFAERQTETLSSTSNSEDSEYSEDSESDLESIICRKPSYIPKQIRVKGELCDQDLPPIEDLHISVKEEECLPFGKVYSIVDTLLVIQSLLNKPALNLDSVFFRHNGVPIGRIFDVFGPVERPFYSVRFNSNKEIIDKGLQIDMVLYAAPHTQHTQYVFAHHLMKEKGSDASWVNDCEPPAECLDYSDDEQERSYSTRKHQKTLVPIKQEIIEDEVVVKKKCLSFEERMNENNALRNKHCNRIVRPARSFNNGLDLGWHNRMDRPFRFKSKYRCGRTTLRIRSPAAHCASTNGGIFQMRAPLFTAPPLSPASVRCSMPAHLPPDYRPSFPPSFDPRYPPPGPALHLAHPHNTSIHFSPPGRPPAPPPIIPPIQSNAFYEGRAPPLMQSPQSLRPTQYPLTSAASHDRHYFPNYPAGSNSFLR